MNGGSQQWLANGYETETAINEPVPATFSGTTHPEYLATTDYVFSQYTNTGATLIADVRSKDEYDGLISGYSYVNAKGRIPNSVWASDGDDGSSVYNDDDGTLRSYTEVRDLWKGIGITSTGASNLLDKEVVFQCGSGYRSSLTFLYAYLMGYDNIRNYSDGWEGWSTAYIQNPSCDDGAPGWCQTPSGRPIIIGAP
jgi:thiosulfate/3-mercaptopyruvate sulfurtransferase